MLSSDAAVINITDEPLKQTKRERSKEPQALANEAASLKYRAELQKDITTRMEEQFSIPKVVDERRSGFSAFFSKINGRMPFHVAISFRLRGRSENHRPALVIGRWRRIVCLEVTGERRRIPVPKDVLWVLRASRCVFGIPDVFKNRFWKIDSASDLGFVSDVF
uniref:Uncharacterized protein n=1 Tax=Ananas comosus var. bracteatus TaxID=296719 RepID=A0A6V7NW58_ANACO|nr:unnamed protein product [Ananas comosus var. bracteatus]